MNSFVVSSRSAMIVASYRHGIQYVDDGGVGAIFYGGDLDDDDEDVIDDEYDEDDESYNLEDMLLDEKEGEEYRNWGYDSDDYFSFN